MGNIAANFADTTGPWLFLDASGLRARVGIWQDAQWLAWSESEAPALDSLFAGTRSTLAEAKMPWENLSGFIYIAGPGSVLGLRLAAMAIRTWQTDDSARIGQARPVWTGGSLHLAATLALAGGAKTPFAVFSEARQGLWQLLEVNEGDPVALAAIKIREAGEKELPSGKLFHLPARKMWQGAPPHAQPLPASLQEHPEILKNSHLLNPTDTAVPYAVHAPEYKKWAGAVH